MKLEDWPIWVNSGHGKHWYECFLPTPDDEDGPNCYGALPGRNGLALSVETTFGELARATVEHAKGIHGIEIERAGSWYESYTPSGNLWAGSSSVDDFTAKDLDGMEGEELTHWTFHNAQMAELTYRRIGTYMVDVVEEWSPDGDA